jgi:ankyrin repeat protein
MTPEHDPPPAGIAPAVTVTAGSVTDPATLLAMLFDASLQGSAFGLKLCMDQGADVNAQDDEGMTPLHHVAAIGARPCIRLLVGSGRCDYLIRDGKGRYAFELAAEWARDYAVARLLASKQAQQAAAQGVPPYVPRT